MSREGLRKLRLASRILIGFGVLVTIPLGMEIFGDMDPARITVWAVLWGIGIMGGNACTILWGMATWRRQRKEKA